MDRSQMTFYASFWDAINSLPKRDQLPVFRAVISYGLGGEHKEALTPTQNAFFTLMHPVLDSSRKKAANGKQGGSKPEANGKQTEREKEREKENEKEVEIEIENESKKKGSCPAPTKKSRKSFGEFGWVKLTDEEYHRLSNDLGEAEVKRCIAYVDESAQSTGNKNKWRDWNLVIRKCSREGWGLSRYGKPKVPTGSAGASGQLGNAELENIQRLLKEG